MLQVASGQEHQCYLHAITDFDAAMQGRPEFRGEGKWILPSAH